MDARRHSPRAPLQALSPATKDEAMAEGIAKTSIEPGDDKHEGKARLTPSPKPTAPAPVMSTSNHFQLAQRAFHLGILLYYMAVNVTIFEGMQHVPEKLGRPKDDPVILRMQGGTPTYFTLWNLIIHELYFSLCCLEYLLELLPKAIPPAVQEHLITARRIILPTLLFPSSCEVVFNFWTLYSYSPHLVFGDFLDVLNPMWLNHAIHTFVVPIAAVEMFFRASSEGVWNGGFFRDVNKLNVLFTAYLVAILVGYYVRKAWPYPFMDPMNAVELTVMITLCYITGWIWFCTGRCLSLIFSVLFVDFSEIEMVSHGFRGMTTAEALPLPLPGKSPVLVG